MARLKSPPFVSLAAARSHFDSLGVEERLIARRRARSILSDIDYPSFDQVYFKSSREHQRTLKDAWSVVRDVRETGSVELFPLGDEGQTTYFNFTPLLGETSQSIHELVSLLEGGGMKWGTDEGEYDLEGLALEAVASSLFEGAATTTEKALRLIETQRAPKGDAEKMVVGNLHLMRKAWERRNEDFSPNLVCELHKTVAQFFDEDSHYNPGNFRRTNDVVVVHGDAVVHTPPDASTLERDFERISLWLSTSKEARELPPWIVASALHFALGWLHPFHDGNGRVARALFYWFMFRSGFPVFRFLSLSRELQRAPAAYVKAYVCSEQESLDLTYFLLHQGALIQDCVREARERTYCNIKHLQHVLKYPDVYELDSIQLDIAREIFSRPFAHATVDGLMKRVSISETTLRRHLHKLCEKKILIEEQRFGVKLFRANPQWMNDKEFHEE